MFLNINKPDCNFIKKKVYPTSNKSNKCSMHGSDSTCK